MSDFIPVNEPCLNGNEKKYLNQCIDSGWISSEGPFVSQFEENFAAYVGKKYAIAVSNGSAALDVAVKAMGIKAGDEVIMPSFTIVSCANAVIRAGATPVFIDARKDTWNMEIDAIEGTITEKTKAIMIVHIYGLPVDVDPVIALCKKYNLRLIEDAAEGIGLEYKNKKCGSFGDISTFSFYPNKHVTTGEGGMVVTDDPEHAEYCRSLRNLCFGKVNRFCHEDLGWNFRMSNLQAAVGLAQLENIDSSLKRKIEIGEKYNSKLSCLEKVFTPVVKTDYADNCYWVYGLVLRPDSGIDRDSLLADLAKRGVGTRQFFWPMHKQPVLLKLGVCSEQILPGSEFIAKNGFYIPSGLAITDQQITTIIEILCELLG